MESADKNASSSDNPVSKKKLSGKFYLKVSLFVIIFLLLKFLAYIMCMNLAIYLSSKDHIYSQKQISALPYNEYGLLLGTSDRVKNGQPNLHFVYRVDAAAELYHAGKIKKIIASGDPRPGRQNEIKAMQRALIARNVPEADIILDPKGLRTIISIQQAKKEFHLKKFTIISQEYHNYRAVYLAKAFNLDIVAYSAKEPPFSKSIQTKIREVGARVKAILELFKIALEEKN